MAAVGIAQAQADGAEPAIVTAGSDLDEVARLLGSGGLYTAADVVAHVLRTA